MLPWSGDLAGRLEERVIASELLKDNPLGDPFERPVIVYLPPGYDEEPDHRYPVIYIIMGYGGYVTMWQNRQPFRQPPIETADQVFAAGTPPAVLVYVDAWTKYGGSQYVDSPGTGKYHSYLCDEVVPWVDARYRTLADRSHRAIAGKSSGGFGAMITPMLRPDLFGALATHAGDALYELCYLADFGDCARVLREYDGDIWRWWDDFSSRTAFARKADQTLLGVIGVAACFSADAQGNPQLPFDPVTGKLRNEIWQRWLDWDPVRMVPGHAEAVRSLHSIWIDAGNADDYYLDLGAEAFREELTKAGVSPEVIKYEIFEGTHSGIEHRYPLAIAWLSERMSA